MRRKSSQIQMEELLTKTLHAAQPQSQLQPQLSQMANLESEKKIIDLEE